MLTLQKQTIISCLTLFFCLFFNSLAFGQGKTEWLNDKVTIRFQEEPMSSVLGKLSQQTGIAILYDEKLAGQKVTGLYKDIKFAEAINRLFSETNKSIQVLKHEKKIIVKTFGAKNFILASSAQRASSLSDQVLDNFEKMTFADLEKMHRQQYKEYKEEITNKNRLFEGGMTLSQMKAMHEKQRKKLQARLKDPHSIVMDGDVTLGELQNLHNKQKKQLEEGSLEQQDAIYKNEMTHSQITAMHKKQKKALEENLKNENYIINDGITLGQLRKLHQKQINQK